MGDEIVGAALGFLMGVISGLALVVLLLIARPLLAAGKPEKVGVKDATTLFTPILSIPTFWFGGPWLTGSLLHSVDMPRAAPFYTITLAICFGAIALRVLFPLITLLLGWLEQNERARRPS